MRLYLSDKLICLGQSSNVRLWFSFFFLEVDLFEIFFVEMQAVACKGYHDGTGMDGRIILYGLHFFREV